MGLLLDSVIFIDHFNGIEEASQFIEQSYCDIHVSVITRAEVLIGFSNAKDSDNAKQLLDLFPSLNITKVEADLAAELRAKHRWKLPDALQAAVAVTHSLQLVTRNSKDFNEKKHNFVVLPYKI